MIHDTSVIHALDFLLELKIAITDEELWKLQSLKQSIDELNTIPLIECVTRAPLSQTPEQTLERLVAIDPGAHDKVATAFLGYEKIIRDAVYFIQRSGFKEDELCQTFIERGRELTELFLTLATAVMSMDLGEDWSAGRVYWTIARNEPTYTELLALLQTPPPKFIKRAEDSD